MKMFCITIFDNHYEKIKKLGYLPVGLGQSINSKDFITDKTKINISEKNPYYGEYTFYYWYWKNLLNLNDKNNWVGFCSYREYWGKKEKIHSGELKDLVLRKPHEEWEKFDAIIGEPIFIGGTKLIKILKYGKLALIRNPKSIFSAKGKTIRWQFDMFHGNGNLDKAIELLSDKDRDDFKHFTRSETSFPRGNMFISNSKPVINAYFENVFKWLKDCESIFGFNLEGYSQIRMYTFLAERYLPYWFKKYTKFLEWPVIYKDINKND